jgi:hypothetical protein
MKIAEVCCARRLILLLTFILIAGAAEAANVTVGCAGATGTFDFPSITAALQANPGGNVAVTVSGTCSEAVVLANMQNVQLIGTPGAALVDPGDNPANFGAVLEIDNSQNITVQNLSIQVAVRAIDFQIPVVAVSGSNVDFRSAKIEGGGPSDGIDVLQSTVRLIGATVIENNNDGQGIGEGVFVQGPSASVNLRRDLAGNCPLIQGNGDNGIWLTGTGALLRGGCAVIQNNGLAGISASGGANITLGVPQATPSAVQILNNGFGVVAIVGSHLLIHGPVLIQGNATDGVRLRNASGEITSAIDGTAGPTIQQNGSSTASFSTAFCCALPAGISVANNADLDISAGLVINNSAPGLLVQDNSSVRIIGGTGSLSITQNPVGVSVTNVSTAALFLAPSVSGNANFDITCGPDAVAYGDLSAVGRTSCQQFKQLPNPGQPPKRRGKPLP